MATFLFGGILKLNRINKSWNGNNGSYASNSKSIKGGLYVKKRRN
jgi:hypothetical protein